ncbi:hypothetical protein LMH87_010232 [Akanthomyces muscarius]|uniref:Uncharacterized protein n=1 Tax=Akanthomyces muscarius TaxID=2231603 RepID=A0A9W8QF42_AKAMU|nr:hypothetical protein LMH87_010232 [Akanthomyces muscarius]KAJ4153758.1 hypothetical protein LMH87_010232 [Akanthomyces muscarius]
MKLSLIAALSIASLAAASPVTDSVSKRITASPLHCDCIIDGDDGVSRPCGCNTGRTVALVDGRAAALHCMCLIQDGDGNPVPCDCNHQGSFATEGEQAEKRDAATPLVFVAVKKSLTPQQCLCIIDGGDGQSVPCHCGVAGSK